MGRMTEVVITDSALENLLGYQEKSADNKQRIQSTISALRRTGTHSTVIKLRGSRRPLWCSKIDIENSIYFTHGQGPGNPEIRIAFFGPTLPENSSTFSQLIYLAGEAPFWEIPKEITLEESRTAETFPDLPERTLGSASGLDDYLDPTDNDLLLAIENYEDKLDDLHGRPFRVLKAVRSPTDLPARLSPKQRLLLHTPPPLLIQGVAGSGKTTILTHLAHQEMIRSTDQSSILIVAYTKPLKNFIKKTLENLSSFETIDTAKIDVFEWRELCSNLAERADLPLFQWVNTNELTRFLQFETKSQGMTPNCANLATELAELIRAVLKGNSSNPDSALIDRKEFLNLENFQTDKHIHREKVYELASAYQYNLSAKGLSDDLDAARTLANCQAELSQYNLVIVDETQDYTEIQLRLLASLCHSPQGLIFAGDMNQVVHPSYFTWERVRTAIWKTWRTSPPQIITLDYNYRNPLPVCEIANTLLKIRLNKLNIEFAKSARSNQASTPMPIRIVTNKENLDRIIAELATQIGLFGVIQDSIGTTELEGIEFQRSFTPQTAKGLEFDVVCLVNFNNTYCDLSTKGKTRLTPRQLFLKYNEVYVSTTRTRRQLLLIDLKPERDGLWNHKAFDGLFTPIDNVEDLLHLTTARFKLNTQEEWQASALDFELQKAFAAAGECWERAGQPRRAAIAYQSAADRSDSRQCRSFLEKARQIFWALRDYDTTADLSKRLEMYSEAAKLYTEVGELEKAAICWIANGNHLQAADAYERLALDRGSKTKWHEAGIQYEKAKRHEVAAKCFESAKEWENAANRWLEVGSFSDAARCTERCGNTRRASEYHARHCEQTDDLAGAGRYWELAGKPKKAARYWESAGNLERAQWLMGSIGDFAESARLLQTIGRYSDAAEHYQRVEQYDRAAECLQGAGEWHKAAEQWLVANSPESAADCYEKANEWHSAAKLWESAGQPARAANCFENNQEWLEAAELWAKVNNLRRAAVCFQRAKAWAKAGDLWRELGEPNQAASCYRRGGDAERAQQIEDSSSRSSQQRLTTARPQLRGSSLSQTSLRQPTVGHRPTNRPPRPVQHQAWPDLEAETRDHERSQVLLTAIRDLRLPSFKEIEGPGQALITEKSLRVRVEAMAQALESGETTVSAEIKSHREEYARLFDMFQLYEQAAQLWATLGDATKAAESYRHNGSYREASTSYLAANKQELAALCLEETRAYAEATLIWLELENYLKASKVLDLIGQNKKAFVCDAIFYERQGNRELAEEYWNRAGKKPPGKHYQHEISRLKNSLKALVSTGNNRAMSTETDQPNVADKPSRIGLWRWVTATVVILTILLLATIFGTK